MKRHGRDECESNREDEVKVRKSQVDIMTL